MDMVHAYDPLLFNITNKTEESNSKSHLATQMCGKVSSRLASIIPILLLIFHLASLSFAQPAIGDHKCISRDGNYTGNSTYKTNLNTVLSSITTTTQIDNGGFSNFSTGQPPDRVYALGFCRGDLTTDYCRSFLTYAQAKLIELCPVQKEAIGTYWEGILLRYSDRPIFGLVDTNFTTFSDYVPYEDLERFNKTFPTLWERLRKEASMRDSGLKFATGVANVSTSFTLYGLMQCIPDMTQSDCSRCLQEVVSEFSVCCRGRRGVKIIKPRCLAAYDNYQFYSTVNGPVASQTPPSVTPPSLTNNNKSNSPGDGSKKSKTVIAIVAKTVIAIVAILATSIVLATSIWCFSRRQTWKELENYLKFKSGMEKRSNTTADIKTTDFLEFDFGTVRHATENFSDAKKLGHNGHGAVYKGTLSDGQEIAVKKVIKNFEGEVAFKNEIELLANLQHKNLIKLLGFCCEEDQGLLIYEFMPNKSLDQFLYDADRRAYLDWETRYKIITGIVRGLLYLHEDSRLRVIHLNLGASNILLDANMNPKISNFGRARSCDDQSKGDTSIIVGTYGYMPPEHVLHGCFSTKSDVFSFGVLLLEIISGLNVGGFSDGENSECLLGFAWRNWVEDTPLKIVDPMMPTVVAIKILRCIKIALLCVQEDETKRPKMSSLLLMLNSHASTVPEPSMPAFVGQNSVNSNMSSARYDYQESILDEWNHKSDCHLHV